MNSIASGLPGGASAWLNVTAAQVVKAAPGVLVLIIPVVAGTTEPLTLNDCATTGAADAANQIYSIPAADVTAGVPIKLNWPCGTGIVVSSVPSGGTYSIAYA